jgi:quercetin dioxygenase-like cupin family protein
MRKSNGEQLKIFDMATTNRPQLHTLIEGETYKAIQLKGIPGMVIPYHHNTGEALLMVKEGEALLRMADGEHTLGVGSIFIIPANKEHTLTILTPFQAVKVMSLDAEIHFI